MQNPHRVSCVIPAKFVGNFRVHDFFVPSKHGEPDVERERKKERKREGETISAQEIAYNSIYLSTRSLNLAFAALFKAVLQLSSKKRVSRDTFKAIAFISSLFYFPFAILYFSRYSSFFYFLFLFFLYILSLVLLSGIRIQARMYISTYKTAPPASDGIFCIMRYTYT